MRSLAFSARRKVRSRPLQVFACRGERLEVKRYLSVTSTVPDDRDATAGCPVCGATGCRHMTDASGAEYFACFYDPPAVGEATRVAAATLSSVALADTFSLSSRPTATKTIYLDFTGHVTTGTAWQQGRSFTTPAFSLDTDFATFSDPERILIQDVWSRVVEDFSPFDVNVTTQEPPLDDLRNTGGDDTRWGMRVVIGGDGSWMSGAAGVAYLNSFDDNIDNPCFVFAGQSWKENRSFMTTCISHEVGHTLGLKHDGYNGSEYYGGRGSGETSWGPIMGNPSSPSLTQWSRGDYGGATNTEDDLTIITTRNGFGFRPDDHGDTTSQATVAPAAPAFAFSGIVSTAADVDVFSFITDGKIEATISPLAVGANLDVLATITDSKGTVIATSNPLDRIAASFSTTAPAGTYFLSVRGTGAGNVNVEGYSAYGSIGQYTVSAKVSSPETGVAISATAADGLEGDSGARSFTFTVTRSGSTASASTVSWAVAGAGASQASPDDFIGGSFPGGAIVFGAGETSKTISIAVAGDVFIEEDEGFVVSLFNPTNAVIGTASATGIIRNDDTLAALAIKALVADNIEGNTGATPFTFEITRTGLTTATSSVLWTVVGTGPNPAAATDFTVRMFPGGLVSFAPGETSKIVTIQVIGDALPELDERFDVVLSNAVEAVISGASAFGVIRNDDALPIVSLTATSADKLEGNAGITYLTFTVTRSGGSAVASSARWAVVPSGANPVSPIDFTARALPAGRVSFAIGETTKMISIAVSADLVPENDETFSVVLDSPLAALLVNTAANGIIRNDDVASQLAISAASADKSEGSAGTTFFTFTVIRTGGKAGVSSARWAVMASGANPVSTTDFAARVFPAGIVSFAPGETTKTISVAVAGDKLVESDETFVVGLGSPTGASIAMATAGGIVRNDDVNPAFALQAIEGRPSGRRSLAFARSLDQRN